MPANMLIAKKAMLLPPLCLCTGSRLGVCSGRAQHFFDFLPDPHSHGLFGPMIRLIALTVCQPARLTTHA